MSTSVILRTELLELDRLPFLDKSQLRKNIVFNHVESKSDTGGLLHLLGSCRERGGLSAGRCQVMVVPNGL